MKRTARMGRGFLSKDLGLYEQGGLQTLKVLQYLRVYLVSENIFCFLFCFPFLRFCEGNNEIR